MATLNKHEDIKRESIKKLVLLKSFSHIILNLIYFPVE